jgi:hypothetical protein
MPEESKRTRIPEKIITDLLDKNAVTVAVAAFFLSSEQVINMRVFRFKTTETYKTEKTEE